MSEIVALSAEMREDLGTGPARALRRAGMVPGVVYGHGKKSLNVSVEEKEITKLYRKPGFSTTVIQLEIGEKNHKVLPKVVDLHPIKDIVRHIDFVFLDSKHQKVKVPLVFEGKEKSLGVKRGGFFNMVRRSINLMCPSGNIPKNIVIDVNNMYIGQSIKASSIKLPEGCKLLDKADLVVASITGRGGKEDAEAAAAAAGAGK
jgi:large subunit ribosomal protein L25